MLQFFVNGVEYTSRTRLEDKFNITHTRLQLILAECDINRVVDRNKFYFEKAAIEAHIQNVLDKK